LTDKRIDIDPSELLALRQLAKGCSEQVDVLRSARLLSKVGAEDEAPMDSDIPFDPIDTTNIN
jgi:hypothetical protein